MLSGVREFNAELERLASAHPKWNALIELMGASFTHAPIRRGAYNDATVNILRTMRELIENPTVQKAQSFTKLMEEANEGKTHYPVNKIKGIINQVYPAANFPVSQQDNDVEKKKFRA